VTGLGESTGKKAKRKSRTKKNIPGNTTLSELKKKEGCGGDTQSNENRQTKREAEKGEATYSGIHAPKGKPENTPHTKRMQNLKIPGKKQSSEKKHLSKKGAHVGPNQIRGKGMPGTKLLGVEKHTAQ